MSELLVSGEDVIAMAEEWARVWDFKQTDFSALSLHAEGHAQVLRLLNNLEASVVRLRFSNVDGSAPFSFSSVTARSVGAHSSEPIPILVGGRAQIVIAVGAEIVSDPIGLHLGPTDHLRIETRIDGSASIANLALLVNTSLVVLETEGPTLTARSAEAPQLTEILGYVGTLYSSAVMKAEGTQGMLQGGVAAVKTVIDGHASATNSTLAIAAATANAEASGISGGITSLANGTMALANGAAQVSTGTNQLAGGLAQLSTGGDALSSGAEQLASGGDQLAAGIGQLAGGADQLAGGHSSSLRAASSSPGAASQLSEGMNKLSDGNGSLAAGTVQLASGMRSLGRDALGMPVLVLLVAIALVSVVIGLVRRSMRVRRRTAAA